MINQNLKILHTAFFLSELRVSTALLIILQSRLALYQLLLHKKSVLLLLWLASYFTENSEQIRTHFLYFYFAFSVLWSSPVEQLIKSEVLITPLPPLTMVVTIYFKGLWQDFVQFLCQTKNYSIDGMIKVKEMVTKFS